MQADPIFGKNFWGNIIKIGDDGKDEGKIHYVYNNKQAKEIKKQTEGGNTAIDLSNMDKVTLNGGVETVNGVKNSVEAQFKDTSPGANDAGLHEEGGDTRKSSNGNTESVAWNPGPKKGYGKNASINIFNGVKQPSSEELLDYWHVHTSKKLYNPNDSEQYQVGSMYPSGDAAGSDYEADFGVHRQLEAHGYNATAIQVGTSSGIEVNFYNGNGKITTLSYNNFLKLAQ